MKLHLLRAVLMTIPILLQAQNADPTILRPAYNYSELQAFLNLSSQQLDSLVQIQANRNQALQAIYTQINDKYTLLYTMMSRNQGTAAQLGQLLLDIQALQNQVATTDAPFRTQAAAVLNADQKGKLPTLVQAMQLQTSVWQAIDLMLMEGSNPVLAATGKADVLPAAAGLSALTQRGRTEPVRIGPVAVQ